MYAHTAISSIDAKFRNARRAHEPCLGIAIIASSPSDLAEQLLHRGALGALRRQVPPQRRHGRGERVEAGGLAVQRSPVRRAVRVDDLG